MSPILTSSELDGCKAWKMWIAVGLMSFAQTSWKKNCLNSKIPRSFLGILSTENFVSPPVVAISLAVVVSINFKEKAAVVCSRERIQTFSEKRCLVDSGTFLCVFISPNENGPSFSMLVQSSARGCFHSSMQSVDNSLESWLIELLCEFSIRVQGPL